MKAKQYYIVGSIFICCATILPIKLLGITEAEQDQIDVFGISTLSGLKAVIPVVLLFEDEVGKIGPLTETRNKLEKEISTKLRGAGLKLVKWEEGNLDENARLTIYVQITQRDKGSTFYSFSVNIVLIQNVQLVRDPKIRTYSGTWTLTSELSVVPSGNVRKAIKDEVARQVNGFCKDYFEANSKHKKDK